MPVPKFYEMYAPILNYMADGEVHSIKEIKQAVVEQMQLTDADLAELLPSGKQAVFDNRVGWARTYLKKAGLIDSPARARFVLTEDGKKALPDAESIDNTYLKRYSSFRVFQNEDTQENISSGGVQRNRLKRSWNMSMLN